MFNDATNLVGDIKAQQGIIEKEINGKRYSINLLPASKGFKIFFRLTKTLAPTLASLADNMINKDAIMPEVDHMLTQAVMLLTDRLDENDFLAISTELLKGLRVDGSEVDFETFFRGNYGELLVLLEWSLKANFADAFTSWLKEKGLEIPTLSQILAPKVSMPEESESESNPTL